MTNADASKMMRTSVFKQFSKGKKPNDTGFSFLEGADGSLTERTRAARNNLRKSD